MAKSGPGSGSGTGSGTGSGSGTGTGSGSGTERCPHCHREFKRLRAHLPHCKAAPRQGPGPGSGSETSHSTGPGSAPGSASGSASGSAPGPGKRLRPAPPAAPGPAPSPVPRPAPASTSGPAPGPGSKRRTSPALGSAPGSAPSPGPLPAPGPGPGPGVSAPRSGRGVEPAVQDVARALDLPPEEVEDVPRRMEDGVKVVIEKHRARVVREKQPKSRAGAAAGTDPGRAAHPQRAKTAPKSTQSPGAVRGMPGSKKGGKSSLKAIKVLEEPPEGRNSRADLAQQEGTEQSVAGGEQVHREGGVGYKGPVSALHPKNLHLSVTQGLGGHSKGTSKNELSSLERLRDSREQMVGVSEPVLGTGRDPGLALHQSWLHSPEFQPTCSSQASGRSTWAGATGLEWFPDLYPECEGLRIFPGKHLREDVGITVKTPRGSSSEGPRGPLSERPLLEVRLGELHTWISTCHFSAQGLLGAAQKAWNSYYAKYINVRRGGPAGISMLLAGYCLLSYSWNYQHFKRHRWRKYH
ncbi:uncharacterized protein C17orf80 homolog [Myiozetetes cayanensis]|uniref:uncharacterized protein C17orf80 homolog n=1 Tax=Myiozetetes cayanensis TaxID=478635 RepID=UPI00215E13A5|nr:uncharacterized protein C17orf80 homolog [Myiozetetes cayanensis]